MSNSTKFKIDIDSHSETSNNRTVQISNLKIVGHISIDGNGSYRNDMSQLRYYKKPKHIKSLRFDLNKDYDKTVLKPEEKPELQLMLRWTSEHFDELECKTTDGKSCKNRWLEPEIISYRGVLTNLITTPFDRQEGWILCASKFEGTIYLCMYDSDTTIQRKLNPTDFSKKCCVWGRKLEQFLVSESPSANPDLSVPYNQFEEYICIFKSQIDEISLLYGAEIDAVDSEEKYEDTLVGKKVEFVEIKSMNQKFVKNKEGLKNLWPSRILNLWAQSYLAGINKIVCGHRANNGFVNSLHEMDLAYLEKIMKGKWKIGLNFLNEFLKYIKTVVQDDYDEHLYKFTLWPEANFIETSVLRPEDASEYMFLKQWYIDAAKEFKKASARQTN